MAIGAHWRARVRTVCARAHMCIWACVCARERCTCVCGHASIRLCMCRCICVCVCVRARACMQVCAHATQVGAQTEAHVRSTWTRGGKKKRDARHTPETHMALMTREGLRVHNVPPHFERRILRLLNYALQT